ncbi:MAG: hypothetical protein OXE41_02605 [Gammaproteobacteria bacterium]|nr:hypothetical protein [Gammaproteobacteria bacterium]MCY4274274.1 hypothetical protein [Gammaproteobacteria bacterium]
MVLTLDVANGLHVLIMVQEPLGAGDLHTDANTSLDSKGKWTVRVLVAG